jgi:hypothetical protein
MEDRDARPERVSVIEALEWAKNVNSVRAVKSVDKGWYSPDCFGRSNKDQRLLDVVVVCQLKRFDPVLQMGRVPFGGRND